MYFLKLSVLIQHSFTLRNMPHNLFEQQLLSLIMSMCFIRFCNCKVEAKYDFLKTSDKSLRSVMWIYLNHSQSEDLHHTCKSFVYQICLVTNLFFHESVRHLFVHEQWCIEGDVFVIWPFGWLNAVDCIWSHLSVVEHICTPHFSNHLRNCSFFWLYILKNICLHLLHKIPVKHTEVWDC